MLMRTHRVSSSPRENWMRTALGLAAVYNITWGTIVVVAPGAFFSLAGLPAPNYPQIWQCVGMIVGVYGVGYALAAIDPLRHWPIVLVGLLGKILGPLGFAVAWARGELSSAFAVIILFNDVVWWVPFVLILRAAYLGLRLRSTAVGDGTPFEAQLDAAKAQTGQSLLSLSNQQPLLLVFLRHLGCTFCREALADLAEKRGELHREGVLIALVHMGDDAAAHQLFSRYSLDDVPRFSDPHRLLYAAFDLQLGTLRQLFGPRVWWRGVAASLRGHSVGRLIGNGFQMPGVFLLHRGRVVRAFRHQTAADRPNYCTLARTAEFRDEASAPAGVAAG